MPERRHGAVFDEAHAAVALGASRQALFRMRAW